jgi:hypothetical protein
MDFSPESLIYLQTIKNYFESNEEARKYFLSNLNEDEFYNSILKVAENNFRKTGEPQLTQEQLEFLRVSLMIFKKVEDSEFNGIYFYESTDLKFYYK